MYTKQNAAIFLLMLQVLFIGLKLGEIIDWSWPWIFAPIWAPAALTAFFFFCVIMFAIWAAANDKSLVDDNDLKRWKRLEKLHDPTRDR